MRSIVAPVAPRVAVAAAPKIQNSFQAVRFYSAGGALNKEEVEGRIISLLQGFDKVSLNSSKRNWTGEQIYSFGEAELPPAIADGFWV